MTPAAGLYVHLPWCVSKCPYCDFNSYTSDGDLAETRYTDALIRDLEAELADGYAPPVGSVFFGGGTPSLFSAAAINRLLEAINQRLEFTPDVEITLEANPGSAEAERFAGYRRAGVNRLSLGIQSFAPDALRALGRTHSADDGRRAIDAAAAAGFSNLNLDLMFGLPGALPGSALDDLRAAIACSPQHLSWYQLTLEEGTAFARNPPALPTHDSICDDYDAGLELLAAAGYAQYEISAHAQHGYTSRHNLNYWSFGDYIGIGAGAHGKRTRADGIFRRQRIRQPQRYMKSLEAGLSAVSESTVARDDLVLEFMLNALRLRQGFTLQSFTCRTGIAATDPRFAAPLAAAVARGWLERSGDRVVPSATGFRFLNELQALFLPAGVAP